MSVVPGNHDAYVPGALDKVCRAWGAWMSGDDGQRRRSTATSFPYLRVRGKVALIGATSARATAPFMANGFFREDQAHRLGAMLDAAGKRGLFRVVMIHHPPVRNAVPQHKRLFGIGNFQKTIRRHGAELVLHGHSHLPSLHWIDGKRGKVPVVGVAAAGQAPGGTQAGGAVQPARHRRRARTRWRVRLTRRGLTGAADAACRDRRRVELYAADSDRKQGQKLTPSAASLSQSSAAVTIKPDRSAGQHQHKAGQESRASATALRRQRLRTAPAAG